MIATRGSFGLREHGILPHRFLKLCITLSIPDAFSNHINVGHVTISHHTLDTNFRLRD
jgi:hypothetical protein